MKEIVSDLMYAVLVTSVIVLTILTVVIFSMLFDYREPSEVLAVIYGVCTITLIFSGAYLARSSLREEDKDQ